ncbi:VCBS repeat-containing protein, partial [bacterium]
MKLFAAILAIALLLPGVRAAGQVLLPVTPNWISTDGDFSTGAALVDINQDGWLDLVVANGNDIERQHVVVYYNKRDGTFPTVPDWQSGDIDYHGHIAVGDVNGDGLPDVAVSVYIGAGGFNERGYVKLYMNQHGTLESIPSWRSGDSLYTFSCAFGDANGDGAPDLAVASGEAYNHHAEQDRIYLNGGGRLDSLPSWKSHQPAYSYDVGWGDFDNDGRLDLVFANEHGPNVMYKNYGDSIGTVPYWQSADPSQYANSLALGDLNNDGYLD